jgi:hypothetical protein
VSEVNKWILLSYTLPAEPSSKRVLVWRHLRKLGAILQDGVWLAPASLAMERGLRETFREIHDLGGHAIAFYASDLTPSQSDELRAAYNDLRREEYIELLQRCERFQAHVQRLTEAGEFKFGAVEELEEDLEKRRRSLAQLVARDVFDIEERNQVEACIKDCEAALAQFIERAYLAG